MLMRVKGLTIHIFPFVEYIVLGGTTEDSLVVLIFYFSSG